MYIVRTCYVSIITYYNSGSLEKNNIKNGDCIGDFISIPNGIPPALKPGANLSRGASFAVADASILGAPVESVSQLSLKNT